VADDFTRAAHVGERDHLIEFGLALGYAQDLDNTVRRTHLVVDRTHNRANTIRAASRFLINRSFYA